MLSPRADCHREARSQKICEPLQVFDACIMDAVAGITPTTNNSARSSIVRLRYHEA